MSLCFVTQLTLTISFGEAWPALQWVVTDSTKHPKQWETGQRRKRKTTRLVLRRTTAKVFDFYSMQTSKRIAFSSSPCHLLPKSPLWHPSLFFPLAPPSHSSLHHLLGEQYPPGLWDSFVSELEMLAQPDHVSNFHFLKSLREHPGFYQCPLHWARGREEGGKELELPGQSLSHQWTNDSLFELRSGGSYRPPPLRFRFAQRSLWHVLY